MTFNLPDGDIFVMNHTHVTETIRNIPTPVYRLHATAEKNKYTVLLDFSLTVKAATLKLISGCGSAISSAKEGKSGFIYNLVKS